MTRTYQAKGQLGVWKARIRHSAFVEWLVVAAAYYGAGRLALLLAIPPGYATAVWPGAGIALAAVLFCGYRVWPAILVGSFLLNLRTGLDGIPALSILQSGVLAAGIGTGAALQASLGAFLVRRFVGFPTALAGQREVLRFLFLGGPISCLVGATVGVTTLAWCGVVDWAEAPFSWCTWWVGDTIGAIIFAPLLVIWIMRSPELQSWRRLMVSVPLALTFASAVFLFVCVSAWEQGRVRVEFEKRTDNQARRLRVRLDDYVGILYAIRAFFASSPEVDRQGFHTFVDRYFARHPGIQALSWDVWLNDAQRPAYEEAGRKDGYPDFQVTEQDSLKQMVRAERRAEYMSICFIEPYAGNERALGLDAFSFPNRREALAQARDTGQAVATSGLALVQDEGEQLGLLVFLPIYRRGLSHATIEERRQNLQGYATAVFRIGDMMNAVLAGLDQTGIRSRLYDRSAPGQEWLLHGSNPAPSPWECRVADAPRSKASPVQRTVELHMAGRLWAMEFSLDPKYLVQHRSWAAWTVLAGGLSFTGLLGAFLLVVSGHTTRVEEDVAKRTLELQCANSQIQKLNHALEQRVLERTEQLAGRNQDLTSEIFARAQAEKELRQAGSRLQALSTRLVQVQELERRHLARELHDEVGQALTATKINLQAIQRFPDADSLAARLEDSIGMLDHLLAQVRKLSLDLRPPMLDDLGLVAALRWYVDQQAQRAGLHEQFITEGLEERLEPTLETACFRVAQEALTNVVRHARAEKVTVEVRCENDELCLKVRDDGVGFDVAAMRAEAEGGASLGLLGMEERVSLAGGSFVCRSAPHRGTEIQASFPLKRLNSTRELEAVNV